MNISKQGIATTAEVVSEEYTLKYGHIFRAKSDYTDEDKALVKSIPNKQDKLTLTTKANGNIVIGNIAGQSKEFMPATPSGDAMHYHYLTAYPELSYNQETDRWSYLVEQGGLSNLTTDEVRKIFVVSGSGLLNNNWESRFYESYGVRTNFVQTPVTHDWGYVTNSAVYAFLRCYDLEVAVVANRGWYMPSRCQGMFFGCSKLHTIIGAINLYYAGDYANEIFKGCTSLQNVQITQLRSSISFTDSPNLSKASILYMIENSAATSSITITLHPTAYARANADTQIKSALASKTFVKLASA